MNLETKIIPIFPLELVLFPRQELPLRIFEPRYKQLVEDCMLGDGQFGVCLANKTEKILGWESPYQIGTIAKITKCEDLNIDGMQLYIETIGRNKFKINQIIPPSVSMPLDYDPYTLEGHQKISEIYERNNHGKMYIQAETEPISEICESISVEKWESIVELWKNKIIMDSLPKIINPFSLDQVLAKYGLLTDIPTVEYVYSLAALGASNPYQLQPILEATTIENLFDRVEQLLKIR